VAFLLCTCLHQPGVHCGNQVVFTGIKECELTSWSVAVGDEVEEFQQLCEVASDKAAVEITSRFAGTVERLHHQPGDMVQVVARLLLCGLTVKLHKPVETKAVEVQAAVLLLSSGACCAARWESRFST